MILDQTLADYQEIDRLSREIEQALHAEHLDSLVSLVESMTSLQQAIKHQDAQILDLARLRRHNAEEKRAIDALLGLMQTITARNQRLLPRIHSIMAVQRDEMRRLHTGTTLLKGYRSVPRQSGGRISSAN
jgi:hypothetical protein